MIAKPGPNQAFDISERIPTGYTGILQANNSQIDRHAVDHIGMVILIIQLGIGGDIQTIVISRVPAKDIAVDEIIAQAAAENILSFTADEGIVACFTNKKIITVPAVEGVIPLAAR